MNADTGAIRNLEAGENPLGNEIPVDMRQATGKQKKFMRVSLNDRRSPLGQQLTSERRSRNQLKRDRRKARA
jgi:hypothetical protein